MTDIDEFDTMYADYPTCPWCGYEHDDYSDFSNGEYQCSNPECEKYFEVETDVSVTFTTRRVEK